MPYTIKPTVPYVRPAHSQAFTDPSWSWLAKQDFDPQRAWQQQTTARRGTLTGGPSYQRFMDFGNEQQWSVIKPRPVLTTPLLSSDQEFYRRQLGAVEWDSISPFNTLDQLADQAKQATGEDPLGFLRGASTFLASKDVDPMGMGSTGAPVRAADYALAFPIAIFNKLTGQRSLPHQPLPEDDIYRNFHADPRYWQSISTGSPVQLKALATAIVSSYADPVANGYMLEQLQRQFEVDREKVLAISSGNPAVDYQAIKGLSLGSGFTKIPVIGTQVAEFLDPIKPAERARWAAMPAEARLQVLNTFGMRQMTTDFVAAMPALSGLGTVISVARGGGVVARSLAQGYDWTLRGAGWIAGAGLLAATTNWSLEAAVPGYSEFLGEEVDHARPISGSHLAGAVNALGYWATGTYGASNLIRGAVRMGSLAREANIAVKTAAAAERGLVPSTGLPEMAIFTHGHGGGVYADKLVGAGLDPRGLSLSSKRLIISYLVHYAREPYEDILKAIAAGEPTGRKEIDMLPPEERLLAINDEVQFGVRGSHAEAELYARILTEARKPGTLFRSDEGLRLFRYTRAQSRTINEAIAASYLRDYGPSWVTRTAGAYTEDAMRGWVGKALTRMGGDIENLRGIRGTDGWAKIMRAVHQYEFDYRNGELQAALEVPGLSGDLPNEAGKLSLVSSRHLFNDEAEAALAILRSDDETAVRAEIDRLIDSTIEVERWFSDSWKPPQGSARERGLVKGEDLASWLEDVQSALLVRRGHPNPHADTATLPLNALHARLVDDGVWELAFKPVNDAGEAVSYVRTRNGSTFQTPWLDYPLGNVDNIELGNRGMAMAKYDSVFRGFRTWRVAEFQRGLLYRSLTGRFPMTAAQIDAFHAGVLQLARRFSVQPQSLGTVAEGIAGTGTAMTDAVDALARSVFGEGPYLARDGTRLEVDWRKEIAQSYRQSLRLNLTAGLTSHLKSRFGPVGSAAAWLSDIGYVNLRFNLSPLFKGGEVLESRMYNALAGVNPGGDPWVEALFYRAGVGDDFGVVAAEQAYDQALAGLNTLAGKRRDSRNPAEARQAAAYVFHAKQAPETFEQKAAAAAIQARVEAFQQFTQGGNSIYASPRHALEAELASLTDEFGNILPGMDDRADEIARILTGQLREDEVRAMHRVGTELPDETWSLDPLDLGTRDYFVNDPSMNGLPDWIDPDSLPGDRGLWHATTAIDSVHASGLKSRLELVNEQWVTEPKLYKALGNAFMDYHETTVYYMGYQGIEVSMHPNGAMLLEMHNQPDAAFWAQNNGLHDPHTADPVTPNQITRVTVNGKNVWKRKGQAPASMGLGAASPDKMVSVTTDYNHASTIAERLRMAIGAARNETTSREIIDHFEPLFDELGKNPFDTVRMTASSVANDLGLYAKPRRTGNEVSTLIDQTTDWSQLERLLDAHFTTGREKFKFVQKLDNMLDYGMGTGTFERTQKVVLAGNWQSMATGDAAQVGVVQVGVKKGAPWKTGPDHFEVQLNSDEVWTLDQRILDQPLATDREGLLAQLRQTVRDDGTTIPGFADYHAEIVRSLAALDEAAKPLGELMPETFAYGDGADATAVRMANADGWQGRNLPMGFLYHGTRPANIAGIQKSGLTPNKRGMVFFDPPGRQAFATDHGNVLLRVKEGDVTVTPRAGGVVAKEAIPAEQIEVWGADDAWHPLMKRVDQVDRIEDVFGTPEHLTELIAEQDAAFLKPGPADQPGYARRLWEEIKNPVPGKQHQATLMRIEQMRREFPLLLRTAGLDGVAEVFGKELHLAERDWLPFLLYDRELATEFHNSGTPEALQALMEHAGPDVRGRFDELYASEEWSAVTGLFALGAKTASDEAFRVHFFNPYRSAAERSLNHPLMGVYPLSWAYKAAREWMRFLYENRTFGELRLGMSPAVALSSIVRAQNIAFAQSNPVDLETYIGTSGPFGSSFMIFNLLLPGDWSTIPFPMSRTIRDALRGNLNAQTIENNIGSLGAARDARLGLSMLGELANFALPPGEDPADPKPWRPHSNVPAFTPSTLEYR